MATEQLDVVLHEAQRRGLLGAAPLAQHLAHAAAFVDAAGASRFDNARVVDLGSGAGVPGLVIASRCATARVTLLDGRSQRSAWLQHCVERLGWTERVDVLAARAEDAGRFADRRETYDVAVARGFGPPAVTAECAAPLLRTGGILVVSEPPHATNQPSRWPAEGCGRLGLVLESVVEIPWSFAILHKVGTCPDAYPRRVGIPAKRPLF